MMVGVVLGIVILVIIIILLANRNAKNDVVTQEPMREEPKREKPDVFSPENNQPIGNTLSPASLYFCQSCGRRLHGIMLVCPYCKKHP